MARVTHVKAAQRKYSAAETGIEGGIAKGQSYYWWKFLRGAKRYSLTMPRRSQTTQSAFYAAIYDIEDRIADLEPNDSLIDAVPEIAEDLRSIGEDAQSSLDNMPEGLQQGSTGELLQERIDAMDSAADELEGIELEPFEEDDFDPENVDRIEGSTDEEHDELIAEERVEFERTREDRESEYWQEKLDEVQGVSIEAP